MKIPGGLYTKLVKMQQFKQEEPEKQEEYEPEIDSSRRESFSRCSVRSSLRDPIASNVPLNENDPDVPTDYGGLLRLYRNSRGHYNKLVAGTLFSLVRGLELPFYVLLMNLAYLAFQNKHVEWDVYKVRVFWLFMSSIGLAVLCCVTIFGAVRF
jgi:hypothetical protein